MTVAAPPHPPEPAVTSTHDAADALIEEAKQRARRRRRVYGAITVVALVAAIAATAAFNSPDTTRGEPSARDAPAAADPGQLVASLYAYNVPWAGLPLWLYLYADGRLLVHGGVQSAWSEQHLTPEGVELVRAEILSTGLFDPEQPVRSGSAQGPNPGFAQIQVRNGDRLVYLPLTSGQQWTSEYTRLVGRLRTVFSWLPANAWAPVEPTTYLPKRYRICTGRNLSDVLPLLPATASAVLNTASPFTASREIDPATYDRGDRSESGCLDLTTDQARRLATALDTEFWPHGRGLDVPGTEISFAMLAILPHGVVECACYG